MAGHQQETFLRHLMSILWFTHFVAVTADYTSYGNPHSSYNAPWLTHNKHPTYATYPAKSQWYPIAGPYTYGPAIQDHYTSPSPHHYFQDHPPGFSQQQIVHIHDVGPPDVSNEDNYEEGNDYNIHNIINHVDTLHQDLAEVASSKVEVRKEKPSSTTTPRRSNLNKRRAQNKSGTRKRNDNKRRQNQASSLRRRRPVAGQAKTRAKSTVRKNSRPRQPVRLPQRREQQFRRKEAPRRNTRPTRRTHSRRPYDYEYYGRRRGNYEDYRENDYKSSDREFARQEYDYNDYDDDDYYYYYDYDNYDETTSTEPTSTDETTTATIATTATTTTTEAPETITAVPTYEGGATVSTNTSHEYDLHGYGPSNGNENISITYAPIVHDNPFSNLWYSQQGIPDIFQYRNYFSRTDWPLAEVGKFPPGPQNGTKKVYNMYKNCA